MLHLCVEGGRFQPQESRCLRLIAAAFVERGFDQLDLEAFDCVVEVDAVVIEVDLAVSAAIIVELSLQSFDFTRQGFCEQG